MNPHRWDLPIYREMLGGKFARVAPFYLAEASKFCSVKSFTFATKYKVNHFIQRIMNLIQPLCFSFGVDFQMMKCHGIKTQSLEWPNTMEQ